MIGRVNTGGGGAGNVYAAIGVTYPQGSICTCTDGHKTIKAKGTIGTAIFIIPYAATWRINCTNGTDTAFIDVPITSQGQAISVDVSYRLPSIYQEVEYLKSTGGQYINTGIIPVMGRIVLDASYTDQSINNIARCIAGVTDSGKCDVEIYFYNNTPYGAYGLSTSSGTAMSIGNASVANGVRNTATITNINGEAMLYNSKASATGSKSNQGTATTSTRPIYLFGRNNGGSLSATNAIIYSFKMYDINDVLIHDFIPCYRKSDNVAGMYDSISKQFYLNSGSGSFAIGGNV